MNLMKQFDTDVRLKEVDKFCNELSFSQDFTIDLKAAIANPVNLDNFVDEFHLEDIDEIQEYPGGAIVIIDYDIHFIEGKFEDITKTIRQAYSMLFKSDPFMRCMGYKRDINILKVLTANAYSINFKNHTILLKKAYKHILRKRFSNALMRKKDGLRIIQKKEAQRLLEELDKEHQLDEQSTHVENHLDLDGDWYGDACGFC